MVGDQPVAASARSEVEVRFVNTQAEPQPIPSTLVISTIGPPASGQLPPEDFQGGFVGPGGAPAYSGGGFGGGGGGSGGGFGGGMGGLGGLLGIGGLAAGIVALADNEDGFTPIPGTPISP